MYSESYAQLLKEAMADMSDIAVSLAGVVKESSAAGVVAHKPGLIGRMFGNGYDQLLGHVEQLGSQVADHTKTVAKQKDEISKLRRGSMVDGTKQWLNTTGGKTLAGVGATGLIAAPGAYALGHHQGGEGKRRARNVAFGSGMATGLAAPGMAQAGMARLNQAVAPRPQPMPQNYGGYNGV